VRSSTIILGGTIRRVFHVYLYFTTPRLKGDIKTDIKYNIIIVFCNFVQKTSPIRKQKWFQYASILYFSRCIESFIFRFHIKTISLRFKATTRRNVNCIQLIVNRHVNSAGISTRFVVLLTNVKQECYLILLDYSERYFFSRSLDCSIWIYTHLPKVIIIKYTVVI